MKLFEISDKGDLNQISKLDFKEDNVYLIDDLEKNTVYIWVGIDVLEYKKEITAAWARKLDLDREGSCKILVMKQNREYGSFLAMMDDLRKGLIPGDTIERRPELVLESQTEIFASTEEEKMKTDVQEIHPLINEPEAISHVREWWKQLNVHRSLEPKESTVDSIESDEQEVSVAEEEVDLETHVREAAYFLSLDRYSYNDLCWMLAEKIQKINLKLPSIEDIRKKAEEVFNSSSTYDELCWLNAEIDMLIKHKFIEKESRSNYR